MVAIVGLLGQAGAGKDTVAEIITPVHIVEINGEMVDIRAKLNELIPYRASLNSSTNALRPRGIQVALADPLKEFAMRVYDFSIVQLWGPSEERNRPDERYPREDGSYLTPREALQQLGTEWGRKCWPDTWTRLAMERAARFAAARPIPAKTRGSWLVHQAELVVISDCRFINEAKMLHAAAHEVWRIQRRLDTRSAMYQHASEAEQVQAADEIAQYLTIDLENNGSMSTLRDTVAQTLRGAGL
jgi:hypothetical protein